MNDRQLDDVLRRVEAALDEQDATLVRRVFESYAYVTGVVLEDKDSAIRRLRQLFFGKRTEKTRLLVRRAAENPEASPSSDGAASAAERAVGPDANGSSAATSNASSPTTNSSTVSAAPAVPGHGRNGADG